MYPLGAWQHAAALPLYTLLLQKENSTSVESDKMKAMVQDEYGSTDVLRLEDVDKPVPQDNQVLVRVYASSVNAGDWQWGRLRCRLLRHLALK